MTALLHVLQARPDFSTLSDDGDTVEFLGRTYRLRIESDDTLGLDWWGDSDGKLEWSGLRYTYQGDGARQYSPRPDGMNGAARIIYRDYRNDGAVWWQPPADEKLPPETLDAIARNAAAVAEWGYLSIGLEELHGSDAYAFPIVARAAWVGGVEPIPTSDYVLELLSELYADLS